MKMSTAAYTPKFYGQKSHLAYLHVAVSHRDVPQEAQGIESIPSSSCTELGHSSLT